MTEERKCPTCSGTLILCMPSISHDGIIHPSGPEQPYCDRCRTFPFPPQYEATLTTSHCCCTGFLPDEDCPEHGEPAAVPVGPELDAIVGAKVMGLEVVGMCHAWDPSGGGYSIYRPDEHDGELRPVHLRHCCCEIGPVHQGPCPEGITPEYWEEWVDGARKQYDAERALWGHIGSCLDVVPAYSTDSGEAFKVLEYLCHARPQGFATTVYAVPHHSSAAWGWTVGLRRSVHPPERRQEASWARTEAFSEAVCRAALLAVAS